MITGISQSKNFALNPKYTHLRAYTRKYATTRRRNEATAHMRKHTRTHTHAHTRTRTHTHTHAHAHTDTFIRAYRRIHNRSLADKDT